MARTLRGIWDEIWRRPDPVLIEAGARGERVLAEVRVGLTLLLLAVPLLSMALDPGFQNYLGLGISVTALVIALVVRVVVRRGLDLPWLGFLTSAFDVSLVSLGLALFLAVDAPLTAVNSRVIFEVYFLAIAAAALRYDARVCLAAGLLALVQYLGIVLVAAARWDLAAVSRAEPSYGYFDWASVWSRVIILAGAAAISTIVTLRSQRLRVKSFTDPLTGLVNRGWVDEQAAVEVSRALRYGRPLAVAMLDVDRFKPFNDTHGHAAGDALLRRVGEALRGLVRQSDLAARFGGEEFVLLLPETGPEAAVDKLETVRQAIAGIEVVTPRGQAARVTVSAGVATLPEDGRTVHELLDVADRRLFLAKDGGRDRVVGPAEVAARQAP